MKKRMLIMLAGFGVVVVLLVAYHLFGNYMMGKYMAAMKSAMPTVSTSQAVMTDWQREFHAVGSLRAMKGADLSTEAGGIVDKVDFESGTDIKSGDVLIRLRSEDDLAHLQAAEASLKLTEITHERDIKQFEVQAISQAEMDASDAALVSAKALVRAQKANVEKKMVKAPFAGTVGIRNVDIGQYIGPGTIVTTLQQIDPIYVDFTLSEKEAGGIAAGQKIIVRVDAVPEESFVGRVESVNPKVDSETRTLQVRGQIKNAKRHLLPGMFARVLVNYGDSIKNLTIPQTSIIYNPYGSTVYVVEEKTDEKSGMKLSVVRQTFVTTGETRGDQVTVVKGLNEGDVVVTTGQMKLQNGTAIKINNQIQPKNDADPQPKDK